MGSNGRKAEKAPVLCKTLKQSVTQILKNDGTIGRAPHGAKALDNPASSG